MSYYEPKHSAARKHGPLRNRVVGVAMAASATVVTGLSLSPAAEAAGSVWDRVAACESGGNWAINTGNGYYGGLQFSGPTWKGFGGGRHAATANKAGKAAQISIARRVLAAQGPGAWPVCSKQAGLTRANGGAGAAAPRTVSRSLSRAAIAVPGRLVVDGVMGPMTIRAIQRWVGVRGTGTLGPTTVRALQPKVGAWPDGVIGSRTTRAIQVKVGARRDGARHLSSTTVRALQTYLNRH